MTAETVSLRLLGPSVGRAHQEASSRQLTMFTSSLRATKQRQAESSLYSIPSTTDQVSENERQKRQRHFVFFSDNVI